MNFPISDKKLSVNAPYLLKRTVFERIQTKYPLHAIILQQMIESGQVMLV